LLSYGAEADSNHNPNGANIFWVHDYLDPDSVSHLVSTPQHYDILADFVLKNVVDHPLGVKVSELNWKRLKRVALRHIVLDRRLKLFICKRLSTYPFKFVVAESCLEQVAQLVVEVRCKVPTIIAPNARYLISQTFLYLFFLANCIDIQRWHYVSATLRRLQVRNLLATHSLPHVLVLEVPVGVKHSVILLNICEEVSVVEDTPNGSVKSVDSGVIHAHFLSCQAFPEDNLWLLFGSIDGW